MARKHREVRWKCASAGLKGEGARGWERTPETPSVSPEVLAPATKRHEGHNARGPSLHCHRPFPSSVRSPQAPGGRGLRPLPLPPPCAAQLSPIRPGPAQPASTHGSDSSGGSSPAPASPPPTPGRSSAAGSEPRGAWRVRTRGGLCTRNRKLLFAVPLAAPEPV